jgi:hypothetical protein
MACHDAVVPSPVARRQGSRLKHHRHAADAPGKKSGGGAHRGGRAAVGWRGAASAVAFHLRVASTGWWRPWGSPVATGGGEGGDCGRGIREEKKTRCGEKNPADGGSTFLKGWGAGSWATCGAEQGRERGGPGTAKNGLGGWHRPPAGGRGWRRCHATAAGRAWRGRAQWIGRTGRPRRPVSSDRVLGKRDADTWPCCTVRAV